MRIRRQTVRRHGLSAVAERLGRSRALVGRTRARVFEPVIARPLFYGLSAAGVVVFLAACWPFCKDHLEAVAVLQQVSGQPVPRLVSAVVGDAVATQDLTLEVESGQNQSAHL